MAETRWRLPSEAELDWREWGEEFVVHDATSARTHLLSAAAGSALFAFLDGRRCLDLDELFASAFAGSKPGDGSTEIMSAEERQSLLAIMGELERLGLVAPAQDA